MALTLITAAATTPITRDEVKEQRHISGDAENDSLDRYLNAAVVSAQAWTGRQFITATYELTLDAWKDPEAYRVVNGRGAIWLPLPPIQAITSVKYIDTAGDEQTVDAGDYRLDSASEPGRLTEAINTVWPVHQNITRPIAIRYTCGFGDATTDVPDNYRVAMLQLAAGWHEHREPVLVGMTVRKLPFQVEALLSQDAIVTV